MVTFAVTSFRPAALADPALRSSEQIMRVIFAFLAIALSIALSVSAGAVPPTADMDAAEAAVDNAVADRADQFAADSLKATGVGLSQSVLGTDAIVACFFGDGAACEGIFHESLNLAAVWNLPILYVCENNQWQAFVRRQETMLVDKISTRGAACGIEARTVDGNNDGS
jgi:hypothetical protein